MKTVFQKMITKKEGGKNMKKDSDVTKETSYDTSWWKTRRSYRYETFY